MSAEADSSSTVARATICSTGGADAAVQRADEQMCGVDALLGRVMEVPRDAPALLDRQALAQRALLAEAAQRVGRVGQRAHEHERQRQMDRQRFGRHELQASRHGAAEDGDGKEGQRGAGGQPDRVAQRQRHGG